MSELLSCAIGTTWQLAAGTVFGFDGDWCEIARALGTAEMLGSSFEGKQEAASSYTQAQKDQCHITYFNDLDK